MRMLIMMLCMASFGLSAQPKKVTASVELNGQEKLDLEFTFADKITFELWDKQEVLVEVMVEINDGAYNDIFSLATEKTPSTVYVEMDEDMWEKIEDERDWNCNVRSRIDYTVYLPKSLEVSANTISGDYEFRYFGTPVKLKTISGVIDLTIPPAEGLDFRAKTITGEVYSDIDITYPEGREGLRQIVGQKFKGRINDGGEESELETISGNIYLRKG